MKLTKLGSDSPDILSVKEHDADHDEALESVDDVTDHGELWDKNT